MCFDADITIVITIRCKSRKSNKIIAYYLLSLNSHSLSLRVTLILIILMMNE